jgi:hypothetical protein
MQDVFVTACIKRFDTLARKDRDLDSVETQIFELVERVRGEAQAGPEEIKAIIQGLEILAHEAELPPPGAPDMGDQGAPLRCAGVLRRAAGLLSGPEKDITPQKRDAGGPSPAP